MADLDSVNRALSRVGVEPVTSLSDDKKQARVMSLELYPCKREVLAEFPWAFARVLVDLPAPTMTTFGGWRFMYSLPLDCVSVYRLFDARDSLDTVEFISTLSGIMTQREALSVEYTAYQDNLDLWPIGIVKAFETLLASRAAVMLSGDLQRAGMLMEEYKVLLVGAVQSAVVEENVYHKRAERYIEVRE